MISRKSASLLADIYYAAFTRYRHRPGRTGFVLKTEELHQFLFENDLPAELLKEVDEVADSEYPDQFKRFIMGLHTGETVRNFVYLPQGIQDEGIMQAGQLALKFLAEIIIRRYEAIDLKKKNS